MYACLPVFLRFRPSFPMQHDIPSREAWLKDQGVKDDGPDAEWHHPPQPLPPYPDLEPLDGEELNLDLEPLPRFELAWMNGPDPEPWFSSFPSTPHEPLSRAVSRLALASPTRPASAAPTRPPSAKPVPELPLAQMPHGQEAVGPSPRPASARPSSAHSSKGECGPQGAQNTVHTRLILRRGQLALNIVERCTPCRACACTMPAALVQALRLYRTQTLPVFMPCLLSETKPSMFFL